MARTSIGPCSISLSEGWTSEAESQQLINPGCVCDTMFNFVQKDDNTVDRSINSRVTSVDLDTVKRAKHIVLSSGGRIGLGNPSDNKADRMQDDNHRRKNAA